MSTANQQALLPPSFRRSGSLQRALTAQPAMSLSLDALRMGGADTTTESWGVRSSSAPWA